MSDKPLELSVLKVRQPIGEFFIASIKAKDLVDISYSDVRRLAKDQRDLEKYLGIQRPVSNKRIKEISLATKNKELELRGIRLKELLKEIQEKEKIREQINHIKGLRGWVEKNFITFIDSTEKNVMAKLKSEFSGIFSEWFSMLVSDSLSVRLDEDFTPLITNQGCEIDYDFLSGGERTATALAYRLSLNQVLNSMLSNIKTKGLVILDEPTDGFSSEQIDKMRDIFGQLKAEQLILVSHEEKIGGFVGNVIRVKTDRKSQIES